MLFSLLHTSRTALVLITMGFYIMFVSYSCDRLNSCSKLKKENERDTIIVYNTLLETDSEFLIKRRDVSKDDIENQFFEKKVFVNSNLICIERYNRKGELFDNTYSSAIVEFEYDELNRVTKKKYFNKNHERVMNDFGGFWAVEYYYDDRDRIKKEIAKNKDDLIVEFIQGVDMRPSIVEYKYDRKGVGIKEFNEKRRFIRQFYCSKKEINTCIPYIDSRVPLQFEEK